MIPPELALFAWVGVAAWLYSARRPFQAAVLCIVGSLLFLPLKVGFDPPGLPFVDRARLGILCAFAGAFLVAPGRFRMPKDARWLLIPPFAAVLGAFGSWATNRDTVTQGIVVLEGTTRGAAVSLPMTQAVDVLLPFLLGYCLIRTPKAVKSFYTVLVGAALVYSILVLYEVRMSPRLHSDFFGYRQAGFGQTVRYDGWRPMVFTEHGLALATFMSTCVIAAAVSWKAKVRVFTIPAQSSLMFLGIVLFLCKSVAAIVYAAVFAPLAIFLKPKVQTQIAAVLALIVLGYPMMRATDVFPTQVILDLAEPVGKSQSLEFRFTHEDKLTERARERIYFGWGYGDRNRIFDPKTGKDRSVTDGAWVITFGFYGAVGFLAFFGTLLMPVLLARSRVGKLRDPVHKRLLAGLALLTVVRAADLLPNGYFMGPLTALLSGALGGACIGLPAYERQLAAARRAMAASTPQAPPEPPAGRASDRHAGAGARTGRGRARAPAARHALARLSGPARRGRDGSTRRRRGCREPDAR